MRERLPNADPPIKNNHINRILVSIGTPLPNKNLIYSIFIAVVIELIVIYLNVVLNVKS